MADAEQDYLWDHVHEFPKSIAVITDFSNSYGHKHKYEHMQQFWCEVSTSLLGAVMRIPIDNLKDSFMSVGEKERLKKLLKEQGLPPLVTITHVMVSPNPHHDTAVVQYFWKNKLYPWIWENTVGLEGGNNYVREIRQLWRTVQVWSPLSIHLRAQQPTAFSISTPNPCFSKAG